MFYFCQCLPYYSLPLSSSSDSTVTLSCIANIHHLSVICIFLAIVVSCYLRHVTKTYPLVKIRKIICAICHVNSFSYFLIGFLSVHFLEHDLTRVKLLD